MGALRQPLPALPQIILSGPVVAGVGDAEPIAAFVLLVRGAPFLSPFRRLPVG
jgi:hypothetical protein